MFNSRWDQHGKDEYDEVENVVILEVNAETLENVQEELIYEIEKKNEDEGIIFLAWERKKVSIPFKVIKD